MVASTEIESTTRLLGLGNEILADDAFGILVAREARRRLGDDLEVICSSAAGFNLIDELVGASRLVVVDTIITGRAKPGTIHLLTAEQIHSAPVASPHGLGLFELLAIAKRLKLPVPADVLVVAVEAADCTTVGGIMHSDVQSAIPQAVELVGQFLVTVMSTSATS
jgi:hydrogenase maturation protease